MKNGPSPFNILKIKILIVTHYRWHTNFHLDTPGSI